METDFKRKGYSLKKNPTYQKMLDPETINDSNSIGNLFETRWVEREE